MLIKKTTFFLIRVTYLIKNISRQVWWIIKNYQVIIYYILGNRIILFKLLIKHVNNLLFFKVVFIFIIKKKKYRSFKDYTANSKA